MLEVEIRTLRGDPPEDIVAGTITLEDGELLATPTSPEYERLMQNILAETLYAYPRTGERVSARDNPEKWINSLYANYDSYALRATRPVQKARFRKKQRS